MRERSYLRAKRNLSRKQVTTFCRGEDCLSDVVVLVAERRKREREKLKTERRKKEVT